MNNDRTTPDAPPGVQPATGPLSAAERRTLRGEILRLAWPAVLENSLHTMVWLVDVAFVGRLGASALSATGLGGQVYFFVLFLIGSVATAATAMISRRVGAGQRGEAAAIASQLTLVGLGFGLVATAAIWAATPLVYSATRLGPEVGELGVAYLRLISLGAPMFVARAVMAGAMYGFGDTRSPMIVAGIAGAVNVVGDWALIHGHLGLPALGVAGAAVASAFAHLVGAALTLWIVTRGRSPARLDLRWAALRPQRQVLATAWRLALPAAGEHLLTDTARTIGIFIIAYLGAVTMAAHEVTCAAEGLSFMPGWGLAVATSISVGQSLGRQDIRRARAATREALSLSFGFGLTMAAVFLVLPGPLVGIFTDDPAVSAIAIRLLRIAGLAQPFIAIQGVYSGALRGAGDTRSPMIAGGISAWLVRVAITYGAVVRLGLPVDWVWWAMVGDWATRSVWMWLAYRRGRWQKVRV